MNEYRDRAKKLLPSSWSREFAYYSGGFGALALVVAIADVAGFPVAASVFAPFGLLALTGATLSLRSGRSAEDRRQYAIEAEPTTFTIESEQADGTPLVELVEETATGDGDECYYTERDAAAMAETLLEEIETDTEREAIADD